MLQIKSNKQFENIIGSRVFQEGEQTHYPLQAKSLEIFIKYFDISLPLPWQS